MEKYSPVLAQREELVVGNKLDVTGADEALAELRGELGDHVLGISGVAGKGVRELAEIMWTRVQEARTREEREPAMRLELDDALAMDDEAEPANGTGDEQHEEEQA